MTWPGRHTRGLVPCFVRIPSRGAIDVKEGCKVVIVLIGCEAQDRDLAQWGGRGIGASRWTGADGCLVGVERRSEES